MPLAQPLHTTRMENHPEMPHCTGARTAIHIFIAEDHRVTLWGLQRLIETAAPRMEVVGTATTRSQMITHPSLPDADVVLMDLDLGGEDAIEVMDDLLRRCPGRVLILTGEDDPERHRQAVLSGARGVLHKSQSAEMVLHAIDRVHAGEIWLERGLLGDVLGRLTGRTQSAPVQSETQRRIATLTPRERQIVSLMTRSVGLKQLAVADELGMSEHTLRNHLTTIYSKLKVRGRLELHVFATDHGLTADDVPVTMART